MGQTFPLFPEQASTHAGMVDNLYFFLIAVTIFFSLLISLMIVYFAVKYRRARHPKAVPIEGNLTLELLWSGIPLGISMVLFVWGAMVFFHAQRPPRGAIEIYAVGKQWMWKFQHMDGQREINELHVPVGRNVKLTLTTEDVLHNFGLPEFRTKIDVVPGRYTYLWFQPTKPGKYHLFCQEYCGLNHSGMGGWVYVMEQRDFDNWLSGNVSGQTPVEMGQDLFMNKLGCASCHTGGPQQRGAKLEGIFNHDVKLVGGTTVKADEQYIRNSILNPAQQVVEGYQPIMPTFKGQVTEEQLNALIAYIKSLSPASAGSTSSTTSSPAANTSAPPAANSTTANRANSNAPSNANTRH